MALSTVQKSFSYVVSEATVTKRSVSGVTVEAETGRRDKMTAASNQMTTRLYGRELREYDDIDFETLLSKLSSEELEELNNDVDPDVNSLH